MSNTTSHGRSRVLFLLVLLAMLATACVTRPLADPAPFAAGANPQQTRVAILRALAESNWVLESERQGEMIARISGSNWTMVVEIAYANEVAITYKSSENLEYGTSKEGFPVIHRGYNTRVLRLAKVIGKEITIARATDSLPPVETAPTA
jgi:DNA-binding transcriptional ArsR family regulator